MHMQQIRRVGGPLTDLAMYLPDDLPKEMCSRGPESKDWCHYVLEDGPVYRYTGLCLELGCTGPNDIIECAPPRQREGEE